MKSTIEQHYPAVLAAWVSAVLAEWVYEPMQIQGKESHRSQVQIQLGTIPVIVVVDCVMELWFTQVSKK